MGLLSSPELHGSRPPGGSHVLGLLEAAGLTGRGGASFPTASKWRAVAERAGGDAVVIANGAEGEPLSRKDAMLMEKRPHLVIDGALIAAESVGAGRAILYAGQEHRRAVLAMRRAIRERPSFERGRLELVEAPKSYIAGEESAAVHFLNQGVAAPTAIPPRPFESGVGGRPTLVQNVETLAQAALIARGRPAGSLLLTLGGAVARPGVVEVPIGATVAEVLELSGRHGQPRAVLMGGYFGGWVGFEEASSMTLDPHRLRAAGGSLGCGVVWVLQENADAVGATARVMARLASESAAQCGPCFFGLRSLADACARIASRLPQANDLHNLRHWSDMVQGRGACKHPDGAVTFLRSALRLFEAEFAAAARAA
ncbi:MAG TPA: NADH-ubiquinone oxidoreductase-F iron-sulfur binding region domain-containing protein [Candidatus Dormibacteraeota bacterium]